MKEEEMQKWEYLVFTEAMPGNDTLGTVKMFNNETITLWGKRGWDVYSKLKELGDEGWELVNVLWRSWGDSTPHDPIYYLKRPKN
jgi:hypothetical protein